MDSELPKLRKRIPRSDTSRSAYWALVDQPSLLVLKAQAGYWRVMCDRVYLMAEEPELPEHVARSLQMERDLSRYTVPTRRDALQAVQIWIMQAADKA